MKPILGFPDYFADKQGNIWSEKIHRGQSGLRKLNSTKNDKGYPHVFFKKNNKNLTKSVHRLILETFVGPCPKGMECRHRNGIRDDNRLENLKWGTRSSNQQDRKKHGTDIYAKGEDNANSKLCESDIVKIRYLLKNSELTRKEIAGIFGISVRNLYHIQSGFIWSHI